MKVIICGNRHLTDEDYLVITRSAMYDSGFGPISEIVSGGAPGIDRHGEEIAKFYHRKLTIFKADWNKYGKRAGPLRNQEMVDYSDAVIAVHDGNGRGTLDTIRRAKAKGIPVFEVIV